MTVLEVNGKVVDGELLSEGRPGDHLSAALCWGGPHDRAPEPHDRLPWESTPAKAVVCFANEVDCVDLAADVRQWDGVAWIAYYKRAVVDGTWHPVAIWGLAGVELVEQ